MIAQRVLEERVTPGGAQKPDENPETTRSICLVASCPGGVASNVVTFLARADVPLSVAMTTVSTLAAIVATPALTQLLVGHLVPIDARALLLSTLQVRPLYPETLTYIDPCTPETLFLVS